MPIFDPVDGGCASDKTQPPRDLRKDDPTEWGKKTLGSEEWKTGQQSLEAKLHRKAASEMVEFISPGSQPELEHSIYAGYHPGNQDSSFEGGDSWEEDDIRPAGIKAIAKEALTKGRNKLRDIRTRVVNRILRRVPFGESIKSAIRRRA